MVLRFNSGSTVVETDDPSDRSLLRFAHRSGFQDIASKVQNWSTDFLLFYADSQLGNL